MSAVYIVLPLALLVVLGAVAAYWWAVRRGEFDDLTTPAIRMLHEDGAEGPPGGESPEAESGERAPAGRQDRA